MGNKSSAGENSDNSLSYSFEHESSSSIKNRPRRISNISNSSEIASNNIIKRKEFNKQSKSILIYSRSEIRLQNEIDAKISNQQHHLIFGYIHLMENQFNMCIPIPIIYLFAAFYCVFRDEWNKHFCGSDFIFIGHKIIKKCNINRWSLCAFGYEVNNKICDILTIEFTYKSEIEINTNTLCIGYININKINTIKWNDYRLGDGPNNNNSYCVDIDINDNYFDNSDSDDYNLVGHDDTYSVQLFTLVFNFIEKTLTVYINEKINKTVKFECNAIIPAVAIYNKGEFVEVSKYELIRTQPM